MAMEVIQIIPAAHEDALAGIAYNPINKQVYTCAEGDKAIKVWDLKTGQLLRTQTVHRGMVTCLAYTTSAKLLFSGSIDGSIGVWTDKGNLLQVVSTGWPVFSLAWSNKQRLLVAGGNSVLHIYKVDMTDVLKVKHARHNAQPSARQQQQQQEGAAGAEAGLRSLGLAADAPQVLRRVCPAFKGWKQHQKGAAGSSSSSRTEASACRQDGLSQLPGERSGEGSEAAGADAGTALSSPRPAAAAGGGSSLDADIAAPSLCADSEAAGSTDSSSRPRGGKGGAGGGMCSNRQREEDFYGVCHADVVKCIVITDSGKIFTAGFDRCICIYDTDKLEKPKEAFKRVKDPGKAGITSLAFDPHNNVLLAGSLDGVLRVWSVEGRCLDKFEGLSTRPVHVAYLPHLNNWWATGRFSKVAALDPRAPALITEFVAAPNQLLEPAVQLLYAPPGSDLVIAGTTKRQLLVWQYNPHAARRVFCGHSDWVEGVLVCPAKDNAYDQSFLSFSADGHVACWELDAEQNCDIFRQVEDTQVVPCNMLCLLHLAEQQRVVCGCEDGTIRLHTLDARLAPVGVSQCSAGPPPPQQQQQSSARATQQARDAGGGLLPTVWTGHEGKVTGLVLLPSDLILSCSEDRSLRVWDLKTMKQLHVELDAHDSAIQCLEYCAARKQAATCGMGAKVKIWSLARPTQPTLALVLDHTDPAQQQQQEAAAATGAQAGSTPGAAGGAAPAAATTGDVNPTGTSNMRWLIKSELAEGTALGGKRKGASTLPDIVAEAIAHAAEDVPEVMQVRWIGFKDCWVTAADDGLLRLWSTAGTKVEEFAYKGGPCRCLYVDDTNQLLLAATADKCAHVFDISTGFVPLAKLQGHQDIISGIGYLPSPLDCYVTSSWDQQLRLWRRPQPSGSSSSGAGAGAGASRAGVGGRLEAPGLLPEDSEEGQVVSEYEKANPLVVPKALSQDHTLALLKAIGITDGGKPKCNGGRGGGRRTTREARFSDEGSLCGQEAADAPGSLGAKLQELGRRLLQDINETAGHHLAGERGLGMQRLNSACDSAGARSAAAPQQQQLRRGGPTAAGGSVDAAVCFENAHLPTIFCRASS